MTRWDGRTWFARTTLATLCVIALGGVRDPAMTGVVTVVALWIPTISLSQWMVRRFRGTLQQLLALAVDLAGLTLVAVLEPELGTTALFLLVAVGIVHANALGVRLRSAVVLLVVATQLLLVLTGLAFPPLILLLDVTAIVLGALVFGERDQHRRRSSAALERADQLTDAVLTGVGEAVVVTDAAGAITSTNDAAELTFGTPVHGSCHAALGLHRGAGKVDCSKGCPLLDPESGTGQADVSRQHPSGTRQNLLVNVRAVRGPTGRVREVVHSYRDITSLKQAEQAKTLFLATASHELKTPVAVITGYVTLLENDGLPEEARSNAIRTIRDRTDQLSQIINRLLLASRIEGGGLTLSTSPVPPTPIVEDRVRALREVTKRDIRLELPTDVPAVDADETAVATVLDHLVENAVKYSPDGGRVQVTVVVREDDVEIDVADEGVGMSPRDAEHCFDAFWQAESDDTRRFGGSGVGLYIVRSLSRAMGGDTELVRAVPGEGTTFRFRLRRSDAVRRAEAVEAERATEPDTMLDEFMRQVGVTGDR